MRNAAIGFPTGGFKGELSELPCSHADFAADIGGGCIVAQLARRLRGRPWAKRSRL